MNRHGVIIPREDGVRARCMGPGPCPECNKDIADAPKDVLLNHLTKYVADGWSKDQNLAVLVNCVFVCGRISAAPETFDQVETIGVPLHDTIPELQFLGALAHLSDHFAKTLQPDELARAAGWLALKYGAMR